MSYKKGQILKDKMDVVKAWADGQEVQCKLKTWDRWAECELGSHLDTATNDYRIKGDPQWWACMISSHLVPKRTDCGLIGFNSPCFDSEIECMKWISSQDWYWENATNFEDAWKDYSSNIVSELTPDFCKQVAEDFAKFGMLLANR